MLLQCPECGANISDKALSCPHCGYPMQPNSIPKPKSKPRSKKKRRRLPNGFGQISEIKGKNLRKPFRAMITTGKSENGRPICKPLKPESYFETYNDAYAALTEYHKNPYDFNTTTSMDELFERWFADYEKSNRADTTVNGVRQAWAHCEAMKDMKVAEIRIRHIKECVENINSTAGIKRKAKMLLNQMFDYAVTYEMTDRNYARDYKLPKDVMQEAKTIEKTHKEFTEAELTTLWSLYSTDKFADMMLIQCYSGWRPQELVNITVDSIDTDEMTITGGMKTSAGKDRIVPIHSGIQELVLKYYDEAIAAGRKHLFIDRHGSPMNYKQYSYGFHQLCKRLQFDPDHRPHDCRVQFVTLAKEYKVDEYAIKHIIGHAIQDLTERVYTKRNFSWLKEEIEKIKAPAKIAV